MKNIKAAVASLALLGLMSACKPAPLDPPLSLKLDRQDVKVSADGLGASHPIVRLGIPSLWKRTTGRDIKGQRTRIALVGTGIDYTNADLTQALAMNLGEAGDRDRADGIDSDQNGLKDDVIGYDFFSGDSLPYDWHGHDTFTASLIGSAGKLDPEVVGVAPNAQLLIVRYISPRGQGAAEDAEIGIRYSIFMGAKVIYFNYGQGGFDEAGAALIAAAIDMAAARNILVVVPAGNDGSQANSPLIRMISAKENVVVVAGLDGDDRISSTSNFGRMFVSVAAPSEGAVGYFPGPIKSKALTTSSVAAAYVAGAAALMVSLPEFQNVKKIREELLTRVSVSRSRQPIDTLSNGPLYLGGL